MNSSVLLKVKIAKAVQYAVRQYWIRRSIGHFNQVGLGRSLNLDLRWPGSALPARPGLLPSPCG